jgi:hypothetical protein
MPKNEADHNSSKIMLLYLLLCVTSTSSFLLSPSPAIYPRLDVCYPKSSIKCVVLGRKCSTCLRDTSGGGSNLEEIEDQTKKLRTPGGPQGSVESMEEEVREVARQGGGGGEPREVASQASLGKDKRCR